MRPLWRRLLILKRLDLLFLSSVVWSKTISKGGIKSFFSLGWILGQENQKFAVRCKMLALLESPALVDYETPLTFADRLSGC